MTAIITLGPPAVVNAAMTTWYVSPTGPGTNCATDGRSPETGFASIQVAIDCATSGDTVRIAAGTYRENVSVTKDLSIIGAGKTMSVIRPLAANSARVVSVSGATVSITKVKITGSDAGGLSNSGTLTLSNSTVSGNTLEGTEQRFGGGIYNDGTLTVKGSSINNNRHNIRFGGGIYNGGTLRLQNSQLNRNFAEDGGGIFIQGPTTIASSQFVGNGGDDGAGAIANFFSGGTVTVSGTKISGNIGDFRGAIDQRGHMVLRKTQILNNRSDGGNGGGIANFPGDAVPEPTLALQGTTVSGNEADFGGGIWVFSGSVSLTDSQVTMNTARNDGGGIFNIDGTVSIGVNSAVTNNTPNDCVGC